MPAATCALLRRSARFAPKDRPPVNSDILDSRNGVSAAPLTSTVDIAGDKQNRSGPTGRGDSRDILEGTENGNLPKSLNRLGIIGG